MAALLRISALAMPFLVAVTARSQPIAETHNTTISKLIEILRTEQNENVRYMVASILPQVVEDDRARSTSPITIDEIAGLLGDRSDAVRGDAASALGVIGPPAARTVPLLVQALKRAEAEFIHPGQLGPSSFSGDQICVALERI